MTSNTGRMFFLCAICGALRSSAFGPRTDRGRLRSADAGGNRCGHGPDRCRQPSGQELHALLGSGKHATSRLRPGPLHLHAQAGGHALHVLAVRTLPIPTDPADVGAANAAQDRIQVQQAAHGRCEIPNWDAAARDELRQAVLFLAMNSGVSTAERFGARGRSIPSSTCCTRPPAGAAIRARPRCTCR